MGQPALKRDGQASQNQVCIPRGLAIQAGKGIFSHARTGEQIRHDVGMLLLELLATFPVSGSRWQFGWGPWLKGKEELTATGQSPHHGTASSLASYGQNNILGSPQFRRGM